MNPLTSFYISGTSHLRMQASNMSNEIHSCYRLPALSTNGTGAAASAARPTGVHMSHSSMTRDFARFQPKSAHLPWQQNQRVQQGALVPSAQNKAGVQDNLALGMCPGACVGRILAFLSWSRRCPRGNRTPRGPRHRYDSLVSRLLGSIPPCDLRARTWGAARGATLTSNSCEQLPSRARPTVRAQLHISLNTVTI